MRVVPSVGSGRYSPGAGMAWLLEERFYQELRGLMVVCSQNLPGNRAIDSLFFLLSKLAPVLLALEPSISST
jgi:hypothetical protein